MAQAKRIGELWHAAPRSVGCEIGEAAEFEAPLLVETLRQMHRAIEETDSKIDETCQYFNHLSRFKRMQYRATLIHQQGLTHNNVHVG